MDGQLIVIVKIHARWALEITIIEIQWDLQPVIREFLYTSCLFIPIQHFFFRIMIKKQGKFHRRMVKITTKLTKLYP